MCGASRHGDAVAKYDPLYHYLRRKTAVELELSFRDIERVLGAMLPNSAANPLWWSNESSQGIRAVQNRAWQRAGYDAFLIPAQDKVCFRRQSKWKI